MFDYNIIFHKITAESMNEFQKFNLTDKEDIDKEYFILINLYCWFSIK